MNFLESQIQTLGLVPGKEAEKMHIVFCADKNYVQHLGVAMTSVNINNYQTYINFHVICNTIEKSDIEKFSALVKTYKNKIDFYFIDKHSYANLKFSSHATHLSLAACYRFAIPYILPKYIKKALYLDCDLVCTNSLLDLWSTDISNLALAACGAKKPNQTNRLKLKQELYFNSGVMLINIERWRQDKISFRAVEFIEDNPSLVNFLDQDGLNKVLDGNFLNLSRKWNSRISMENQKSTIVPDAAIVHFAGSLKPWQKCLDPRKEIYWEYLKISPWSNKYLDREKAFEEIMTEKISLLFILLIQRVKQTKKQVNMVLSKFINLLIEYLKYKSY